MWVHRSSNSRAEVHHPNILECKDAFYTAVSADAAHLEAARWRTGACKEGVDVDRTDVNTLGDIQHCARVLSNDIAGKIKRSVIGHFYVLLDIAATDVS
jgi:hypothetical protein